MSWRILVDETIASVPFEGDEFKVIYGRD